MRSSSRAGTRSRLRPAVRDVAERVLRPAAFLDRDGVLNFDSGYVHRSADIVWVDGAREAVALLTRRGYLVCVVTNQAGVARGYYDEAAVNALHDWIGQSLASAGGRVDAFEYCPHHPEGAVAQYAVPCACRKPAAGMILRCFERLPIDRSRSFLIGDRATDIAAAQAAGIEGHLFPGGDLLAFTRGIIGDDP